MSVVFAPAGAYAHANLTSKVTLRSRDDAPRRQQPHTRSAVPSVRHFDNAQLPYRWVPGLEVRRLPEAHYRSAPRLEVSHTFDWTPGPLWLYGAPGSGV